MKPKRFLIGIGVLGLFSALLLPLPVNAAEQNESTTPITVTVPANHTVQLDIGEHGSVIIDNKTYRQEDKSVKVKRLEECAYTVKPDDGWKVKSVYYGKNGAQKLVTLKDNAFSTLIVNSDDTKLTVAFESDSASSGGSDKDKPTIPDKDVNTGVQTGDTTNLFLTSALLLLSGSASLMLYMKTVKRRKKHE